jgi:TonB family protein
MVLLMTPDQRLEPKLDPVIRVKLQLIPPHLDIPAVSPIPVAIETPGSILKRGGPAGPTFERRISEAQAQNGEFLQQYCSQEARQVTGTDPSGTVVLMIRVEADGRVSDSRIEESVGASGRDEIAQSCITQMGVFEPHRKGDQTVASWQRIHWTWSGT